MRDPGHENTMYMLRSKSVKYISAYPLRIRVSAYPLQCTLRLFLGEGWSSPLRIRVSAYPLQTTLRLFLEEGWSLPLRIHVSAYPLHDQTTLRLFLGKWWSSPPRIHVSTLFSEAPLKWQGILQLLPWPWHFDTLTDWSQIYKDTIKAEYKISSDSIWKPCDIKSEQLPSELQNIKSAFNLRSYVLRVFYKTKLKYNRRKAYLFPETIKLSYSTEQCSSCNFAVADRPPNVSRHRKTHTFPLENYWAHFLLVCEAFKSAFWSKMERKEWKPAFTIFALDWTRQTPFCKYVLPPLSQPLPPKRNLIGETGEHVFVFVWLTRSV